MAYADDIDVSCVRVHFVRDFLVRAPFVRDFFVTVSLWSEVFFVRVFY